tara:strand:+ start:484 stop:729 length:246 start_codon:yes stop_codon:yes gene_type:complete
MNREAKHLNYENRFQSIFDKKRNDLKLFNTLSYIDDLEAFIDHLDYRFTQALINDNMSKNDMLELILFKLDDFKNKLRETA